MGDNLKKEQVEEYLKQLAMAYIMTKVNKSCCRCIQFEAGVQISDAVETANILGYKTKKADYSTDMFSMDKYYFTYMGVEFFSLEDKE